jgi:hypothetical protein
MSLPAKVVPEKPIFEIGVPNCLLEQLGAPLRNPSLLVIDCPTQLFQLRFCPHFFCRHLILLFIRRR